MDRIDCIVVGAGVIGLAVARALAIGGRDVLILEANRRFGAETSSRNNEVIHAGFLYASGTLKAALCREGRDALYRYYEARGVANRRIGKLLIATAEDELVTLRELMNLASLYGVDDLVWLDAPAAQNKEPHLHCLAAIHSPSTGILDAHGLMLALLADAEAAGAVIAYDSRVIALHHSRDGTVVTAGNAQGVETSLHCDVLINAAGLGAGRLARSLHEHRAPLPEVDFAKGNFFSYSGAPPFKTLIVPLGETLASGAAFTMDTGGQGKFGPDVEWVDAVNYDVDPARAASFAISIRRYFPALDPQRLTPNYAGIRPRLRGKAGAPADWLVLGPAAHGLAGVYHLLGFDAPGLTACLAIADHVASKLAIQQSGTTK